MREDQPPQPPCDGEDPAEDQARDRGLLDAGQHLVVMVRHPEQRRGQQDDRRLCPPAPAEDLAEPLEQVSAEHGLFAEPRARRHRENHAGQRGLVSGEIVVRRIDGGGAEQRHHDRLHHQFECASEDDAESEAGGPAPRSHEADLQPRSARRPGPEQDQDRAQRCEEKIAREDQDDREESQRSEAAQPFGADILGRRFGAHGRPARAASTGRPAQPGGTTSSSVPAGTQPVSPLASFTRR